MKNTDTYEAAKAATKAAAKAAKAEASFIFEIPKTPHSSLILVEFVFFILFFFNR